VSGWPLAKCVIFSLASRQTSGLRLYTGMTGIEIVLLSGVGQCLRKKTDHFTSSLSMYYYFLLYHNRQKVTRTNPVSGRFFPRMVILKNWVVNFRRYFQMRIAIVEDKTEDQESLRALLSEEAHTRK